MLSRLKHSDKLALLHGAWRRGARQAARQFWLIATDALWHRRHLVFRQDADALAGLSFSAPKDFRMREITSLDELSTASRARLAQPDVAPKWGAQSWFDLGWRLWVAERNNRIAAFAWWRGAAESTDFFVQLKPHEEILWHVFVLPECRGRDLHRIMWVALARHRVADGITGFLTNCRDFNIPSHRNIDISGFVRIGQCNESRITGRRVWHPAECEERP